MNKFAIKNFYWIPIVIAIVATDRISKILVIQNLPFEKPIAVLPFFNLYFNYNSGAAFSFLSHGNGWQEMFLIGIAAVASIFLTIWLILLPKNHNWLKVALALILGGTLGNLYDRIFVHQVIDFLDFFYKTHHFATFNLADSAITAGAMMLVVDIVCRGKIWR